MRLAGQTKGRRALVAGHLRTALPLKARVDAKTSEHGYRMIYAGFAPRDGGLSCSSFLASTLCFIDRRCGKEHYVR